MVGLSQSMLWFAIMNSQLCGFCGRTNTGMTQHGMPTDDSRCVPFRYDKHHLTNEYAQYMAGFLKPEITAYLAQH